VRGEPGRATREGIAALTARTEVALVELVADFPDRDVPGPFGRWLTELFNEWPEGRRPAPGEGDAAGTDLEARRARATTAGPLEGGGDAPALVPEEVPAG
jgi:hypothetical protein